MFPVPFVEFGLDRTELAGLRELGLVRQHEFDFVLLMLLPVGHVFEVSSPRVR